MIRISEVLRRLLTSGGALTAIDRTSQKIIGSSHYHAYRETRREVEIGWTFLSREYWGGKYNGEMKRLMLKHAFLFVERVIFLVGTGNIRSQRAVERSHSKRLMADLSSTRSSRHHQQRQ